LLLEVRERISRLGIWEEETVTEPTPRRYRNRFGDVAEEQ
jgi:hypothetical protein